jgi:hypothetical protein
MGATGPAGPAGAAGPAGGPGAKGDAGAPGADGDTGAQGPQGPAGAQGPAGVQGAQGPAGADGAPGAKGDTGAAGADGAQGTQGPKGDTGAAGADGAQGTQGPKGDKGDTGAAGADGAPGAKGDKGDPGAKGDKGDPGSAAAYAPIVDVNPFLRPSRSNRWDRVSLNGSAWFGGYRSSFPNGTEESFLEWDVPLQAGTYALDVVHVKSDDAGVLSLSLDGSSLGPGIDAYRPQADGFAFNEIGTFSDVEVATTGIHTLRIATPTKNEASTGYFGYLTWIRLVRQ